VYVFYNNRITFGGLAPAASPDAAGFYIVGVSPWSYNKLSKRATMLRRGAPPNSNSVCIRRVLSDRRNRPLLYVVRPIDNLEMSFCCPD